MNQYSTEPEFTVEELVKTPLMVNQLVSTNRDFSSVRAELALLCQELTISVDILGKIRDSLVVLELSVSEPV